MEEWHILVNDQKHQNKGFDKQFGARPLKRAIQKYVEDSLAGVIITSKIAIGDSVVLDIIDGEDELTEAFKVLDKENTGLYGTVELGHVLK